MHSVSWVLLGVSIGLLLSIGITLAVDWIRRNPRWMRELKRSIKASDRALEALRKATTGGV